MPVLLLVRHAQGSFGTADYDVLSPLGVRQAGAVHRALTAAADGAAPAPVLVAGSLRRQRDTAAPWSAEGATLGEDPRWDEYPTEPVLRRHADAPASLEDDGSGSGTMSSRGFQEILDPALHRWITARGDGPADWPAFRERALAAMHELAGSLASGQTGIAFTSGGVIAACVAALLDAPDPVFVPLNRTAVNTGITKVLVGRRGLSLVSHNEHGHLAPDEVTFR